VAYAEAATSVTGGAIAGASGGFVGGFIASNGNLKAGFEGAFTGALSGGINNYYGSSYPASRIVANGVAGGMGSAIRGQGFASGFKSSAIISSLAYLNSQMRDSMIAQSKIDHFNNGEGLSSGMYGDQFKLAGGRWYIGAENAPECSPLGCWQSGPGTVFGTPYAKGGLVDMVTESFAGPHDTANSFWWYVNKPQQVLDGLGMIGDALPADFYSKAMGTFLEYSTNYTTSLAFALPFASAAILEQTRIGNSFTSLRRQP
jgi:hypothetical protein